MGRAPKNTQASQWHMTKKERELREQAEAALASQKTLTYWGDTTEPKNHAWYFQHVKELLAEIGEDDAFYTGVINRYCDLLVECDQIKQEISLSAAKCDELEQRRPEMPYHEWLKLYAELMREENQLHKMIDRKRNMLLAIEKENMMTVLSKMRAVLRKLQEAESEDPMEELLSNRPALN